MVIPQDIVQLRKALHHCIKQNDLFFQLINDYAVAGYIFWLKGDESNCLIDSRLANTIGHQGSVSFKAIGADNYYRGYIEQLIKEVSNSKVLEGKVAQITTTQIGSKTHRTILHHSSYEVTDESQTYFLLAIESSKFITKGYLLAEFSEILNLASWQCNIQTGELDVNEEWANLLGYTLDELLPLSFDTFARLTHPEDIAYVNHLLSQYSIGAIEEYRCEVRMLHKNGKWIWVLAKGNSISTTDNGKVEWMMGSHIDITERKTQEQQLIESEERLQLVLKGAEIGYWDWEAVTGELKVNNRWFEMLGYDDGEFELTIEKWHEMVHPLDLYKLTDIMESSFSPQGRSEFSTEVRAKHKLGHYVWILDNGAVIKRDEQGNPARVSGMHLEITERKQLEVDLAEQSDFLQNIISAKALSVVIIDKNGNITFANTGAESVLGLEKSEIELRTYNDPSWQQITLDGEIFPQEELPFMQVMLTKKPVKDIQHGIVWGSGAIKYISVSGGPFTYLDGEIKEVIFSVTDITDSVIAQKQLDQAKLQMQSILKEMTDVVWSVNIPDYKMLYVTPSIEKITGIPQTYYLENFSKDRWSHGVYKDDKLLVETAFEDLVNKGSFDLEYRISTQDGQIKWVSNKGNIIYKEGEASRLDGYMADITKRKAQEYSIKEYVKIIEGQNERLRNFTYIVSHNLRSHSSNIHGLLELLNRKNPEFIENEYFKLLSTASNKLEDTLHLLNDTVSVVSSKQQMKPVRLSTFVAEFQLVFQQLIKDAAVDFINEVDEEVFVEVVPAFLDSIITNLITNAVKYRDTNKNSFVKLSSRVINGIVILSVEDNGLGLDLTNYGDKLFGMYKTFHKNKDAKGVGLFITKNQVESMGGKIKVFSSPGVGSDFKVLLKNGNV